MKKGSERKRKRGASFLPEDAERLLIANNILERGEELHTEKFLKELLEKTKKRNRSDRILRTLMRTVAKETYIDGDGHVHFPKEPVVDMSNPKTHYLVVNAYSDIVECNAILEKALKDPDVINDPAELEGTKKSLEEVNLLIQFCEQNLGLTREDVEKIDKMKKRLLKMLLENPKKE